jgi:hypothetical protein
MNLKQFSQTVLDINRSESDFKEVLDLIRMGIFLLKQECPGKEDIWYNTHPTIALLCGKLYKSSSVRPIHETIHSVEKMANNVD